MDFDQGLVGPVRSVERLLELCWWDVAQVAVQAVVAVPVDPTEGRFMPATVPATATTATARKSRTVSRSGASAFLAKSAAAPGPPGR